ncbi:hypothetical protein JF634_09340 [Simonsiella muelleri]|uniref:hypothetical protein n=1 Tax=Simonsiella muelleri TaxID=72 RepID=UPI0001D08E2D|nr:hypothetical protein [Simonsiella muelleri]UBQ53382.1 hypothetical protein JF634_09340 [Simonsiella muelleri]
MNKIAKTRWIFTFLCYSGSLNVGFDVQSCYTFACQNLVCKMSLFRVLFRQPEKIRPAKLPNHQIIHSSYKEEVCQPHHKFFVVNPVC